MDLPTAPPTLPGASPCPASIGVFDSGVGGLSVLRELRTQLPSAPLLYVADSGHAPYGERSDAYVIERSRHIALHLRAQGAIGIVVACNTATAIAVRHLRELMPELPIVGVEPGLKPAVAATRNGRIGVLATPGTLASEKFQRLLQAQAGVTVLARPCPGLARLIEQGDLAAPALRAAIEAHCAALRAADVDTVVLGCTHYAFIRDHIEAAMGAQVRIIDTAHAVARHTVRTLAGRFADPGPAGAKSSAVTRLQTTGEPQRLREIASAWLAFPCTVEGI
ncbi:glutamate racemase [Piscinibacter sp.]|jgi:glutamate racemase|uniref:glutamate racemase n=1 Tax=Piscinibacter sp. TaxID=1903157 RepID=UPI0035596EFA